jgi:hypothetical protein
MKNIFLVFVKDDGENCDSQSFAGAFTSITGAIKACEEHAKGGIAEAEGMQELSGEDKTSLTLYGCTQGRVENYCITKEQVNSERLFSEPLNF